jgi:hypothetical protein
MDRDAKIILGLVTALILFVFGMGFGVAQTRRQAIEAGVARWRADPKTGDLSFEWIKAGESVVYFGQGAEQDKKP